MHVLSVNASKAQARKLIKGQAVRIKQGTGFNLIVHPTTYRLATRAFNKGKGAQIKLSSEEIDSNQAVHGKPEMMEDHTELHGEMTGQGIFDFITKPISRAYNTVRRGVVGAANKVGKFAKNSYGTVSRFVQRPEVLAALKKAGKFAATQLADAGATAVSVLPGGAVLARGAKNLGVLANKAIDDPNSVGGWKGAGKTLITGHGCKCCGSKGCRNGSMCGGTAGFGMSGFGLGTGLTGYSALRSAAKASASANAGNAHFTNQGIKSRSQIVPTWHDNPMAPRSRGMGIVGCGGHMVGMHGHGYYPPALVSQPFSANYQMSHFLPVQYQHFNHTMRGYDDGGSESDEEMHGQGFRRHRGGRGFGLYA